ncbi:MAG: hypothetical protein RBT63_09655, partial [Bdellovibrionales bacterium]|nr:hypothetical protein [Bdellovibrionales bacterium]
QAQTIIADLLSRVGSPRRPISSPNASPTPKDTLALGQISREGTEWTGAYPSGLAGLEVLNLRQMLARSWRDTRLSALWSMLIYPFNSDLALIRLFADLETSFDSWDRLSRERGTFGFLGTDAGIPSSVLGLTVKAPSYQKLFGLASNHVLLRTELTGEYESDRRKILTAIQEGQTYFAFDTLGQTKGFAAWYEDQRGIQSLGARIPLNSNGRILVRLPKKPSVPFEIVILRDSMNVMTSNSTTTEYRTLQSGVYRVVVRLFIRSTLFDGGRWIPWIMTNPITVTP